MSWPLVAWKHFPSKRGSLSGGSRAPNLDTCHANQCDNLAVHPHGSKHDFNPFGKNRKSQQHNCWYSINKLPCNEEFAFSFATIEDSKPFTTVFCHSSGALVNKHSNKWPGLLSWLHALHQVSSFIQGVGKIHTSRRDLERWCHVQVFSQTVLSTGCFWFQATNWLSFFPEPANGTRKWGGNGKVLLMNGVNLGSGGGTCVLNKHFLFF